ncbi:hypothetical protein SY83_13295 [Paenibacillus swuensis]|uniref:AraC family transcriptional regulator n=1 Tax=Paenibacillus swuensis TaxID=1178515 RepID=A0A172TJR6_9BACL|nr:response regulator [Paenibacillus swuensis]ANE47077.1 hypothetical protein SY83_13295 [Paenibacillus swuensis]
MLVVDDEKLTREGLVERIPWSELGVTQVKEADDGTTAITLCATFTPDIILTDVRMSHMDGVEMSYLLVKQFPHCKVIFMSGYTDKQYLLSAIDLKALSYIEKPLNIKQMTETLKQAADECVESRKKQEREQQWSFKLQSALPLVKSEAALRLTERTVSSEELQRMMDEAGMTGIHATSSFRALPVWISLSPLTASDPINKPLFLETLDQVCRHRGFETLACFVDGRTVVAHLLSVVPDKEVWFQQTLRGVARDLVNQVEEHKLFLSLGAPADRAELIMSSTAAAREGLSHRFYQGYEGLVFMQTASTSFLDERTLDRWLAEFDGLLGKDTGQQVELFVQGIQSRCMEQAYLPVEQVKRIYARMAQKLSSTARKQGIPLGKYAQEDTALWETFIQYDLLEAIHGSLLEMVASFRDGHNTPKPSVDLVQQVHRYIFKHYQDEALTIPDISQHIFLTPAYLSSLYKQKTGQTLTQYITAYRIGQSIELLTQTDKSIADIAVSVGLQDANYFARIFRKHTGLTPSEFRKRTIS